MGTTGGNSKDHAVDPQTIPEEAPALGMTRRGEGGDRPSVCLEEPQDVCCRENTDAVQMKLTLLFVYACVLCILLG